jgi:CheY-like chemotaxis protein
LAQILIVENDQNDLRFAEQCAIQCGFSHVIRTPSAEAAQALLEQAQGENRSLPDAILLDLDLGHESGFDLLRIRYKNPELSKIPVVVWTHLGDENRDFCNVFKVQGYVTKSAGEFELSRTLGSMVPRPQQEC